MGSNNYDSVILEEVRGQYSRVLEALDSLKTVPEDIVDIKQRIGHVETDVRLIKKALSAQSADTQHIKRHLRLAGE